MGIHIVLSLYLNTIGQKLDVSLEADLIVSEMTILVPGLIWMLIHNASFRRDLGFKKIKVSTILMTILLSYLLSPLISLVNVLSQLYSDNTVLGFSADMIDMNVFVLVLIVGFFGPFCEEFIFRGIIGQSMKRFGSVLATALVSGLYFGLMHLNFNQFCYAFVLGVIFQIVNYASGSVYTSMIMHTVFNTRNVLLMLGMEKLYNYMGTSIGDINLQEASSEIFKNGYIFYAIAILLVLALIFTAISIPVFMFIARNEGHGTAYSELLRLPGDVNDTTSEDSEEVIHAKPRKDRSWYLNPPSVIATVLCVVVIFFMEAILAALGA